MTRRQIVKPLHLDPRLIYTPTCPVNGFGPSWYHISPHWTCIVHNLDNNVIPIVFQRADSSQCPMSRCGDAASRLERGLCSQTSKPRPAEQPFNMKKDHSSSATLPNTEVIKTPHWFSASCFEHRRNWHQQEQAHSLQPILSPLSCLCLHHCQRHIPNAFLHSAATSAAFQ